MNKRILFLYSSQTQKNELKKCEKVFRAIFRKFRKTPLFSYMELDYSANCRLILTKSLSDALLKSDAVLWHHDEKDTPLEKGFAQEVLGLYCVENILVGRSIFSVPEKIEARLESSCLHNFSLTDAKAIEKTVSLAADAAIRRNAAITLCTDTKNAADKIFSKEAELLLGKRNHLEKNHISLKEFILLSMRRVPLYDVVLTTERAEDIVSVHMSSCVDSPTGYTLWHTESGPVFRREIRPCEQVKGFRLPSLMLAFSGLLEKTPGSKSAGLWLKKCVGLALGRCREEGAFINEVLSEINKPIRNRQVNADDSENK